MYSLSPIRTTDLAWNAKPEVHRRFHVEGRRTPSIASALRKFFPASKEVGAALFCFVDDDGQFCVRDSTPESAWAACRVWEEWLLLGVPEVVEHVATFLKLKRDDDHYDLRENVPDKERAKRHFKMESVLRDGVNTIVISRVHLH